MAERIVVVTPDSVGVLNNVINGDTLADGQRADLNTVYLLKRNGVYKLTGEIQNPGFHLVIRAEQGEGAMPILQPTAPSGGESQIPFTVLDDLTLEGIYVTSVDDFGRYIERMIRVRSDSTRIVLKSCWLDGTGQSIIRLDNVGTKVYMHDCTISNVGRTFVPNNGRLVDARESTDSLVITHNTIYNVTSRVLRISDGRYFRYVDYSHNTIMNVGQRLITFGTTAEARFTNNLIVNPGFLGTYRNSEYVELDDLPTGLRSLLGERGVSQTIEIRNNLFFTDPRVAAIRGDSIDNQPFYSNDVFRYTSLDSLALLNIYTFEEPVFFRNPPALSAGVLQGMINDQLFAENLDNGSSPNWNLFASPFNLLVDNALELPWSFYYNFSYSPSSFAATAATDGGPLGDRNWPLEEIDIVTASSDIPGKDRFRIYPNPVMNMLWLRSGQPNTLLCLYDLSGELVQQHRLTHQQKSVDVSSLKKGIYLLRLTSDHQLLYETKMIKK